MSKVKILVFSGVALILVLSLVAVACAPKAAPTGAPTVTTVTKTVTTTATVTAAPTTKPVKVYRWEPATWISSGIPFEAIQEFARVMNEASNGRVVVTPSAVGAVCPVEEQMEAVSAGTTGVMMVTPSYYTGKIPAAVFYNSSLGMRSAADQEAAYEVFEEGRAQELYFSIIEKNYNVESIATRYGPLDLFICARVPIRTAADLKGVKFRCGDEHAAVPLAMMGASTTWFPGSEIYTSLAAGVVDAFTYGGFYDHYSIGAHEVCKYWHKNAKFMAVANEQWVVNRDIWNEMSDDLKALFYAATRDANDITILGFGGSSESWS